MWQQNANLIIFSTKSCQEIGFNLFCSVVYAFLFLSHGLSLSLYVLLLQWHKMKWTGLNWTGLHFIIDASLWYYICFASIYVPTIYKVIKKRVCVYHVCVSRVREYEMKIREKRANEIKKIYEKNDSAKRKKRKYQNGIKNKGIQLYILKMYDAQYTCTHTYMYMYPILNWYWNFSLRIQLWCNNSSNQCYCFAQKVLYHHNVTGR